MIMPMSSPVSAQRRQPPARVPPRPLGSSGFMTQLVTTVRRQLIQKRRMWVSFVVEMLLPVMFAIGLVGISLASSRTDIPSSIHLSPTGPQELGYEIRNELFCYGNDASPDLTILLSPCNMSGPHLTCLPPSDQLPLTGLCLPGGPESIRSLAEGLVAQEIDVEIPNYDEYVLFKWAATAILPSTDNFFSEVIARARQPGNVFLVPETAETAALAQYMNDSFVLFKHSFGGHFSSRNAALPYVKSLSNEGKVWALIELRRITNNSFTYVLSMNETAQEFYNDVSNIIRNQFEMGLGPKSYAMYLSSGALTLQKALNDYFMINSLGLSNSAIAPVGANSHAVMAPMPLVKYVDDEFLNLGGTLGPLLLVLAYLYPVSQLAKRLVEEKEKRLREGTMIMGLGKAAFFCSWLFVYYVQMTISALILSFIIKVGIAKQSNFFIIFVPYLLFSLTTVNLSALLATWFSKAKVAALCVPLLYFVFSIPAFMGNIGEYASIFCPVPFAVALKLIFSYEVNNGMGWGTLDSKKDDPYNMMYCFIFFGFDFFFYLLMMLYFDAVVKKEWGTSKNICFCCGCGTCCCKRCCGGEEECEMHSNGSLSSIGCADVAIDNPRNHLAHINEASALQDYPQPNDQTTVHIHNLRKVFPGSKGKKNVAVDGVELRLFQDGITVILGHNGAGKTTVMNMMTGMMSPTAGDVTIYGNSIRSDMPAVRRDIGYCPQHNILWDDLTSMEHLQYFARLKGMTGRDSDDEAIEMLRKVDLLDKKDVFSKNLSGGQKRKLSVAIAFMGRAKLVLLDEPTAGMDVAARRHTWDVLKEMSQGRTILLTTHFMDEADLLGSRIAIMSKGSLHSYGSPMYLKNNLGTGYTMRIAAPANIPDPLAVLAEVKHLIPSAFLKESKGQEMSIALPKGDARLFPAAIRRMELNSVKARLSISSVSVSVSSLEEVFLLIAHQEELNGMSEEEYAAIEGARVAAAFESLEKAYGKLRKTKKVQRGNRVGDGYSVEMPDTVWEHQSLQVGSTGGFFRQFHGMMMKRINHGRRDHCALCLQILAPLICIAMAMGLSLLGIEKSSLLFYNNEMYGDNDQIMAANNGSEADWDTDFAFVDSQRLPTSIAFAEHLLDTYNNIGDSERMVSFSVNDTRGNTVLFANATSKVSAPQALHQYYRNLARQASGGAAVIDAAQWTLPMTDRQHAKVTALRSLIIALFILIPFTLIPSTFVAFIVRERECKSKHLQMVSGASYTAYWLANFTFDVISYLVTIAIAFGLFIGFDQEWAVGTSDNIVGTFVLFFMYGLSGIGFAYLASFLFDDHSTAQTVIMMVNFLVGFLLVMLMYFLQNIDSTKSAAEVIVFFLRVIPPYALGDGLFALVQSSALASLEGVRSPLRFDVAGWNVLYMGILSGVFLALTIFIDHPSRQRRREKLGFNAAQEAPVIFDEDDDVFRERKQVEGGQRTSDVVQVQRLRKEYKLSGGKKKVAVQNITFGVKPGEVFGFLGTNGAGKTTTMSMLTTEILPTCGQGRIGGYDVAKDPDMTRRLIGYCPQFDAIMDLLTPIEHLKLFAALRGINLSDTNEVIDALIMSCALEKYRDIPAGQLSGGNKRKLSVAMALIGGPSIVFLDEPSAGMDPHARRQLWDVVIFVAKRSSVVLTTHHLEEVDVLAHRVGIMDQGLMKCLGSLEHLKQKFGNGYELTIQVADNGLRTAAAFVEQAYPSAVLLESRQQRLLYSVPKNCTDLADLFETIQGVMEKPAIGIVDYTVQQTSLEQVFMRISELGTSEPTTATSPLMEETTDTCR